jgi:succinate-semialdehyde dehydrogenase/glutarate-semialdehyde dehydrogenase
MAERRCARRARPSRKESAMSEFKVINPTSGELVRVYQGHDDATVSRQIRATHQVWLDWRKTEFAPRAEKMRAAAALLRARAGRYAELMALEMGKPITGGKAEIEKCAWACDFYAEHAESFLRSEPIASDARSSYVAHRPLGVVLAVMPWNFPFWQVFRFVAPALMAGNAGLLKHASNVPGCALAIEEVLRDAGFPEGLFRTLLIEAKQIEKVLDHPQVVAATLTGSVKAGASVASLAGARVKKTVLELGGSDAYLVLDDADLDHAAESCAASRLINSGQSCIAAKRFVVVDVVHDAFVERFVRALKKRKLGDPLREETEVGPQARADLRDELHRQLQQSVAKGARCVLGGEVPPGPGAFYPPSVLVDVRPGMPAYEEELFGPVASVIRARDEADAIQIANDSIFGLGAAVFTRDAERGRRIAEHALDAGSCFVNGSVRSDPRLPFGGIKESGYGRELSQHGIREFVNIKTVYVA